MTDISTVKDKDYIGRLISGYEEALKGCEEDIVLFTKILRHYRTDLELRKLVSVVIGNILIEKDETVCRIKHCKSIGQSLKDKLKNENSAENQNIQQD